MVSPPQLFSSRKYVWCPPPYWHPVRKICAVSPLPVYTFSVWCPPPFSSVPWTLWLCLGFWAQLRIWKVPACKMKPSSTLILECGTPCWACFFIYIPTMTSSQWGLPGRDQKSQPGSEWVSEPNTINTHRQKRLQWRGKKGGGIMKKMVKKK